MAWPSSGFLALGCFSAGFLAPGFLAGAFLAGVCLAAGFFAPFLGKALAGAAFLAAPDRRRRFGFFLRENRFFHAGVFCLSL